jgi:hypothetical protein
MCFYGRALSRWESLLAHQGEGRQYKARHGQWGGSDVRGRRPCTAVRLLVGRRSVDARRVRTGRARRWHGGSGSGAWTDGPNPTSACSPADHSAVAATPARQARALEHRGTTPTLPSTIQASFSHIFPTEVVQVLNSKVVDHLTLYNFYESRIGF